MNLRAQFESMLPGRVCLIGVGNSEYGDDGLGVCLAGDLLAAGLSDVIVAGTEPDRLVGGSALQGFEHAVFLDAVEFGGEPGAVVFLDGREVSARFPQVSTHKISLGVLARLIESTGTTKAWLLGVQPECARRGQVLSPRIRATLDILCELLLELKTKQHFVC